MSYTPINWNNNTTPINETNLNKMDQAIAGLSDEVDAVDNKSRVAISLVNEKYADTIASMQNGQIAFGHRWSITSDSHPNDTQEGYHFYELYRGGSNYAKVVVTSEYGKWEGFWNQTNGLSWKHDYATNSRLDTETLISRVSAFSINKSGKYYIVVGTDLPTDVSTNGHLEVSVYADVYKVLRYIPHDSNVEYINVCNSGSWLGWVQLGKQSDIDAIKYPVKLFDINSNSYNAGDALGSAITVSLYSGFILYFSYGAGGYMKEIRAIGDMKSKFYWLEMTDRDGKYYSAGVQVRNAGLFVETVGTNKPFIIALYGIPA